MSLSGFPHAENTNMGAESEARALQSLPHDCVTLNILKPFEALPVRMMDSEGVNWTFKAVLLPESDK